MTGGFYILATFEEWFGLIIVSMAAVDLVIAWGLWEMRNWARQLVIFFRSLAILGSLIGLLFGNLAGIGGLGISIFVVSWFVRHGSYFD